ncbi:hypothetical protein OS242_15885 [Tumebacillus sp. DT12]|uniref:PepSY domain-containing protein n=1 Tax=Tumebacillus lacus TaxID=2995335 RepID=A0ABT3X721_9BACL|nr:hypothetical protein [Tumebacillus lacus]MCX7571431.1 hypothetical protein [Tumebacillus lacus]
MNLLLPVSLLTFALLLYGSLIHLSQTDLQITLDTIRSEQAALLADSGLAAARARHNRDPDWRGDSGSIPFGDGTYRYKITDLNGEVSLQSSGFVGDSVSHATAK